MPKLTASVNSVNYRLLYIPVCKNCNTPTVFCL